MTLQIVSFSEQLLERANQRSTPVFGASRQTLRQAVESLERADGPLNALREGHEIDGRTHAHLVNAVVSAQLELARVQHLLGEGRFCMARLEAQETLMQRLANEDWEGEAA